jgi:hypothetical protein
MRRALLLALVALILLPSQVLAKPRARIPDALDDVLDDEESDDWRNWGQQKEAKEITGPAQGDCSNTAASDALLLN